MPALIEIRDENELRALHRALFEAKFHPNPEQPELAASSFIAAMSHRVVDSLTHLNGREEWDNWRLAERHHDRLSVILRRIVEATAWRGWSDDEKKEYVLLLLAPLIAEDETISQLIEKGDLAHRIV